MQWLIHHKFLLIVVVIGVILAVIAAINVVAVRYGGEPVPVPEIPRDTETFGSGPTLRYAVLGDSTAVGQGADYQDGIVRRTAEYLASDRRVALQNFAVSGARIADVTHKQVPDAATFKPDVALLSVGANDVTHLTSLEDFRAELTATIRSLRAANPDMAIVLTGSPDMGSVARFPEPTAYLAGVRTRQVNQVVQEVVHAQKVTFAPIATDTGDTFRDNPEFFAADKFHLNARGYGEWLPVLERALDQALQRP